MRGLDFLVSQNNYSTRLAKLMITNFAKMYSQAGHSVGGIWQIVLKKATKKDTIMACTMSFVRIKWMS